MSKTPHKYKIRFTTQSRILFFIFFHLTLWNTSTAENLSFDYIEDDARLLSVDKVEKLFQENKLKKEINSLNLSFEASNIWIRISVDSSDYNNFLVFQNAHIDYLDSWFYSNNGPIGSRHSGDLREFDNRDIHSNYINFQIPYLTKVIYLRVQTEGPMMAPIKILSAKDYFDFLQQYSAFHYVYFGFVILVLISNLILFVWLKESINLYYCLFLISVGLITAVDFEYTFQYLWPNTPSINKLNSVFYLLTFFTLLFTEKLFNLKQHAPPLYKIFKLLYVVYGVTVLVVLLTPYRFSVEIIFYVLLITPVICLFTGVYFYFRRKSEFLRFFLIGWVIFLLCIIVYTITIGNILPFNFFTNNAVQIGSSIEIIFFNLAVLSRINVLKQEKEKILFKQNKALEDINKQLLDKNQRLEQYASVTNHNLRGPVATLLGLSLIFNKESQDDPGNEFVIEKIKETVTKMDTIIKDLNSLLYLDKNIQAILAPVNLHLVMKKVELMLSESIKEHSAKLHYDFSKASQVTAVQDYLESIFYNLIENSIKYSKPGTPPEIGIFSHQDDENVYIEFTDNGLGIDMTKYGHHIFQPYKKFHKKSDGKGLGLYTIKALTESMYGSISIQSSPGKGTTFSITLKKPESGTTSEK